jgi:hypothetical protein
MGCNQGSIQHVKAGQDARRSTAMNHVPTRPYGLRPGLLLVLVAMAVVLIAPPDAAAQIRTSRSATSSPRHSVAVPSGAFFVTTQIKTFSAAAAVDANGGRHMAFAAFQEYASEPPAFYAYCPPGAAHGCADASDWGAVRLDGRVDEVQLRLTSSGQPRMLIRRLRAGTNWEEYLYAACDAACTDASQWTSTLVAQPAGVDVFGNDNPQRYFALDPQDRPRFVYSNGWGNGQPIGVFYMYCDSGCTTNPVSDPHWRQTPIYEGPIDRSLAFDYPSLTFTRAGQPRIVANMSFSGEAQGLYYLACDAGCEELAGWRGVRLGERGGGVAASWDLELDRQDRPRIAFFQGGTADGSGDRLWYLWCDAACLTADGWGRSEIGAPLGGGRYADLALDAAGRPRIAYQNTYGSDDQRGLGYAWCDVGCGAAGADWQHRTVDPAARLQAEYPVTKPLSCYESGWFDAIPSLALDRDGNPNVAYDALNAARCYYEVPNDPVKKVKVEILWRAARWVQFAHPGGSDSVGDETPKPFRVLVPHVPR